MSLFDRIVEYYLIFIAKRDMILVSKNEKVILILTVNKYILEEVNELC